MSGYVLDTHTWVWDMKLDEQLPRHVIEKMDSVEAIHVSAVSIYEIAQKVRLGKWPEMAAAADILPDIASRQGYHCVDLSARIAQRGGLLKWENRDPFDRMIAATAMELQLPLLSKDQAFDALSTMLDWPGRIW